MNKILESLAPGDRVEYPPTKEKGEVISIRHDRGEDAKYRVKFEDGSVEWYDRHMLVKLGGEKKDRPTSSERIDHKQLLIKLVESLKGKSVYKTLKAISEGKVVDSPVALKGLFSLGTHVAIEVEHGNVEYSSLLPLIHERIGKLL